MFTLDRALRAVFYGAFIAVCVALYHFYVSHIRISAVALLMIGAGTLAVAAAAAPKPAFVASLIGMGLLLVMMAIQHPDIPRDLFPAWFFFSMHLVPTLIPYLLSIGHFDLFGNVRQKAR